MKTAKEVKQYKRWHKANPTPSEVAFHKRLKAEGIPFKTQIIVGFYIVDVILHTKLVAIEIDGREHERKKFMDEARDGFLTLTGFKVIRIRNEDVETFDLSDIKALPDRPVESFNHACWRAIGLKGVQMSKGFRGNYTQPLF